MASTPMSIVNVAMVKLGQGALDGITPPTTPHERTMSVLYPHYKRYEMAGPKGQRWHFASQRHILTSSGSVQERDDLLFIYPLFAGTLRPIREQYGPVWQRRGQILYSPEPGPIEIPVIVDTAEGLFDPLFDEVFACRLAWEACETITQSNQKKKDVAEQYMKAIKDASQANAFERGAEPIEQDDYTFSWITSRFGHDNG